MVNPAYESLVAIYGVDSPQARDYAAKFGTGREGDPRAPGEEAPQTTVAPPPEDRVTIPFVVILGAVLIFAGFVVVKMVMDGGEA